MNAFTFITVTGAVVVHSLLDYSQPQKYDLFGRADQKIVASKKKCHKIKIAHPIIVKQLPKSQR